MVKVIFDSYAATREEIAVFMELAAQQIREGETEVGGYTTADYNLIVVEDAEIALSVRKTK